MNIYTKEILTEEIYMEETYTQRGYTGSASKYHHHDSEYPQPRDICCDGGSCRVLA